MVRGDDGELAPVSWIEALERAAELLLPPATGRARPGARRRGRRRGRGRPEAGRRRAARRPAHRRGRLRLRQVRAAGAAHQRRRPARPRPLAPRSSTSSRATSRASPPATSPTPTSRPPAPCCAWRSSPRRSRRSSSCACARPPATAPAWCTSGPGRTPAVVKTGGHLVRTAPGDEAAALDALPDDVAAALAEPGAVVLVGERAAEVAGPADRGRRARVPDGGPHRLGAAARGGARRRGRRRAPDAAARRTPGPRRRRPGGRRRGLGRAEPARDAGSRRHRDAARRGRGHARRRSSSGDCSPPTCPTRRSPAPRSPRPTSSSRWSRCSPRSASTPTSSSRWRPRSTAGRHLPQLGGPRPAVRTTIDPGQGGSGRVGGTAAVMLPDCRVLDSLAVEMDVDLFTQTPAAAAAELSELGTVAVTPSTPGDPAPPMPARPFGVRRQDAWPTRPVPSGSPPGASSSTAARCSPRSPTCPAPPGPPGCGWPPRPRSASASSPANRPGCSRRRTSRPADRAGGLDLLVELADLPEDVVWAPSHVPGPSGVTTLAGLGLHHGGPVG